MSCKVTIGSTKEINVENGQKLSEISADQSSPIKFGCKKGMCGKCLVQINSGLSNVSGIESKEMETLDLIAKENGKARLACSFQVQGDINIDYIGN